MKKIIRIEKDSKDNNFLIDWMLHDRCTYQCSYCPPANKSGQDDWLKLTFAVEFIDRLESWLKTKNRNHNVTVLFTGGEPTVWPKFIDLVDHIKTKGWDVELITNGSRSLEWWKNNHHKFTHISLSYHSEHVDDNEFYSKIKFLSQNAPLGRLLVNVMMNPERWDKCVKMAESLIAEMFIPFKICPVLQNFGLINLNIKSYSAEQLDYIHHAETRSEKGWYKFLLKLNLKQIHKTLKDLKLRKRQGSFVVDESGVKNKLDPGKLISNNQINFYNWKCNIGLEQIFINSLGKIYGGTCLQGVELGDIRNSKDIIWPDQPTVCKSILCSCSPDIRVTKWKQAI